MKESSIQNAIRELLTYKYRLVYRRNNVHGPAKVFGSGGLVRCGTPGEADLTVYLPQGKGIFRILHIEVKKPGEEQSLEQKIWQRLMEAEQHLYTVATSTEDVEAWMEQNGVK